MEQITLKNLKSNETVTLKKFNKVIGSKTAMDNSKMVIVNEEWLFVEENEPVPDNLIAILHNVYVGQIILDDYEIIDIN